MTLEMTSPGDPFPLTDHRKYNEIARAANAVNNGGGDPATNKTGTDNRGLIRVYNGTTVPAPEFWIMAVKEGLSNALVESGALSPECAFAQGVVYELEAVDPAREQTLCVVQEPIGAENFGQAKLFGVSQAKVDILEENHRFAKLKESQPTPGAGNPQPAQLESASAGGFEIVSRPGGQTGEQWCTVRFPVAQGGGIKTVYVLCNVGGRAYANAWSVGDSVKYGSKYAFIAEVTVSARTVTLEYYDLDEDGNPERASGVSVASLSPDDRLGYYELWYSEYTRAPSLMRTGEPIKGYVVW